MRNCKKIAALLLGLLAAVCCTVKENAAADESPAADEITAENLYIPGALTIQVSEDIAPLLEAGEEGLTRSASVNRELAGLGVVSISRVFPDAGEFEPRSREAGLHRFYKLRLGADVPMTRASAGLESLEWVQTAEPVRRIRRRAIFNDPNFSRQWHYVNSTNAGADINVQQVWEQYSVGSENVIVAVVDEAVCYTHPDLKDNMWSDAQGRHGYNFWDGNWNLSWTNEDDIGHGTHVAGTISAVNNNGVGVCGVAGGDAAKGIGGVKIMSCQIFGDYNDDMTDEEGDECSALAIKWAADNGAVISQNSWGYYADINEDGTVSSQELNSYRQITIPSVVKAAIDYFIANAGCDAQGRQRADSPMKGGLVIFAAGNENINYDPICSYEPVIAVGAFRENGNKASYSNYGSWVDIAAPGGEGISSANSIWSTVPTVYASSGYAGSGWAGTSMACPHASGVAALLISYFGKAGFTAEKCKSYLMGGLGNVIGGSRPIGGKLDAYASFQYALAQGETPGGGETQPENHAPEISLSAATLELKASGSATVTVTASDPDEGDVISVSCTPGSSALSFDATTRIATINALRANAGTYTAVFRVTDKGGLSAEASLRYTILPNHPPVAVAAKQEMLIPSPGQVGVIDLGSLFTDSDGDNLSYSIDISGDAASTSLLPDGKLQVVGVKEGYATILISAIDPAGASASMRYEVAVRTSESLNEVQVYPVLVQRGFYVRTGANVSGTVEVSVHNGNGTRVLQISARGSVFEPVYVNIESLPPSVYAVVVKCQGQSWKEQIVKY